MTIMDRYILRQFIQVYAICFCSLTGLYVVIDAFGNLDEFLAYAEEHGNLLGVMAEYYAYRSIGFFDRTAAILTLISAMFTVTWLERHNELTALLAAGVRTVRVIKPVIVAAVVISVVAAAGREWLIPNIRHQLSRKAQDLSAGAAGDLQPRYDHETDVRIDGEAAFAEARRIHHPKFLLPEPLQQYGRQLEAEDAIYQPPQNNRPGGYRLTGVTLPKGLAERPSLSLGDRPVIITPRDAMWLAADECFVASNVSFDQLADSSAWRQYASTAQLIAGLRNASLDYGADVRVAVHARVVQPLLDVTLLFLGLPLVLARGDRNVFVATGLCLAVVTAFLLVGIGCQMLGSSYMLSPSLAVWLPLMIWVPAAVVISQPLRD